MKYLNTAVVPIYAYTGECETRTRMVFYFCYYCCYYHYCCCYYYYYYYCYCFTFYYYCNTVINFNSIITSTIIIVAIIIIIIIILIYIYIFFGGWSNTRTCMMQVIFSQRHRFIARVVYYRPFISAGVVPIKTPGPPVH